MNEKYIIAIDDEVMIADLLSGMVTRSGRRCVVFNTGIEAVNAYRNDYQNVYMVITDLSMAGMSGIDVAKEILSINPNEAILLITGFIKGNVQHLVKNTSVSIMDKPFSIQELHDKIDSMIREKEERGKVV